MKTNNRFTVIHLAFIAGIILGMVIPDCLWDDDRGLSAQVRRRNTPRSTKPREPEPETQQPVRSGSTSEMEQRNRELLKQIIDLQNERDFYKKKLLEWSEANQPPPDLPRQQMQPASPYEIAPRTVQPSHPQPVRKDTVFVKSKPDTVFIRLKPKISVEDSLFSLAQHHISRKDYNSAVNIFYELTESHQVSELHKLRFAMLLYKLNDFSTALNMLNLVHADDSLMAVTAFYRGRILQQQGMYEAAMEEMDNCRAFGKDLTGAYRIGKGYDFLLRGNLEAAGQIFGELAGSSIFARAEIYAGMAEIEYRYQNLDKAVSRYRQSLSLDPAYMEHQFRLGKILLEAKQYHSSLPYLIYASRYDRSEKQYDLYIGKAFYYTSQWEKALSHFLRAGSGYQDAGDLSIWIPKTYYILSLIANRNGDFTASTTYFRRAREVNPDAAAWMSGALQDLAYIHETNEQYTRALAYYSQLIRVNPMDHTALIKIGELYYANGDIREARLTFEKALKYDDTASRARAWIETIELSSR